MPGIKLTPVKSTGDGYKAYKAQFKNWMQKMAKIKQAKLATQQNKK